MVIAGEVSIFVIFLLQFSHIYFKTTFLVAHVSMVTFKFHQSAAVSLMLT